MIYPIASILLLILDIYVIFLIFGSAGDFAKKLIWLIVVLFLPLIGPILYLLLGRSNATI